MNKLSKQIKENCQKPLKVKSYRLSEDDIKFLEDEGKKQGAGASEALRALIQLQRKASGS